MGCSASVSVGNGQVRYDSTPTKAAVTVARPVAVARPIDVIPARSDGERVAIEFPGTSFTSAGLKCGDRNCGYLMHNGGMDNEADWVHYSIATSLSVSVLGRTVVVG
jgi:hypothetical protein